MCIAIPAEILSVAPNAHTATVRASGNTFTINVRLIAPRVGDWVLVHAGCAVEVLSQSAADELEALYRELEAVMGDDA